MCRFIIKGLFIFLVLLSLSSASAQKIHSEWVFIYWMPYDNNLSPWADSIVNIVKSHVGSDELVVTIQADRIGSGGMSRYMIRNGNLDLESIEEENSASGIAYNKYLNWVTSKISAENYVIVILDHGGRLDEIGLDEYPVKGFMRLDSARMAIENFNIRTGKLTELIFFQVCTKGSVEPIYEMRNIANYTLASQTVLGAPNFYYATLFDSVSLQGDKISSGLDIARIIGRSERDDMFYSYTCFENKYFDLFESELTIHLNLPVDSLSFNLYDNLPLSYYGESYLDIIGYMKSLRGVHTSKLQSLIVDSLIVMIKINPKFYKMNGYSGLSLLSFANNYPALIEKYSHMAFFKNFDMLRYYNRLKIQGIKPKY